MFDPSRKPTQIPSYNPETSPYEREKGGFRVSGPMTGFLLVLLGVFFGALLFTYEVKVGPELNIQEKGSFFGIPGAYAAYGLYLLFGAVAVFLPLIFVWWGIYQMTHKGLLPARVIMSGIGMVLFACIAAGGQQIIGVEWANNMGVTCFGGEIGAFLGWQLITPQLGVYGTVAVATLFYLISLVYLTGMKMRPFLRTVWLDYRQWKEKRQVQEAWTPDHLDRPRDDGSLAAMLDRKSSGVVDPVVAPVEPLPRRESVPVEPVRQREEEPTAPVRPVRVNRVEERRELKEKEAEEGTLPLPLRPAPQIIDSTRMKVVKTVDRMQGREELPAPQSVEPSATESDDGKKKYILPSLNLLNEPAPIPEGQNELDKQELEDTQKRIIEALRSFNIEVAPGDITRGPTITRYEIYPSIGTRVNKISSLEANLALATKAERINILAPIPGKDTVGIEIANSKKVAVPLRELLSDHAFVDSKKKIPLALGKDVYGNVVIGDLAAMPHLLVAGATGSGKSVCINSIISSILFRFTPDELKFILVDPKVVEMQMYAKVPHLIVPVVTEPKKVIGALRWAVNEMEKRYRIFAEVGVRNFESYNNRPREPKVEVEEEPEEEDYFISEDDYAKADAIANYLEGEDEEPDSENGCLYEEEEEVEEEAPDKFPYIVIIIDELADLMQTVSADMETYIARLTAKARAAGIHLIVATQTPRSDVVTGVIKANIPCRIAFQVSSGLDSRIILDRMGAENLVGKGDLYYLPPGSAKLERAQGAFISDEEVEDLVRHCSAQAKPCFRKEAQEQVEMGAIEEGSGSQEVNSAEEEDLLRCIEVIRADRRASVSLLQRRLKFGYNKAARLMDILEERGVVGPPEGPTKQREIYV